MKWDFVIFFALLSTLYKDNMILTAAQKYTKKIVNIRKKKVLCLVYSIFLFLLLTFLRFCVHSIHYTVHINHILFTPGILFIRFLLLNLLSNKIYFICVFYYINVYMWCIFFRMVFTYNFSIFFCLSSFHVNIFVLWNRCVHLNWAKTKKKFKQQQHHRNESVISNVCYSY